MYHLKIGDAIAFRFFVLVFISSTFFGQTLMSPSLLIQVIAVAGWLGFVVVVAAIAHSTFHSSSEVIRKIVHIGTGNVILIAWLLHVPSWLGIGASLIFCTLTLLSYQFPILPFIDSVGRQSFGTFFYSLSIGILICYFWPRGLAFYAVLGVLAMSWGDGLAALIGQRWGAHFYEVLGMKKSWEGSLVMFLATFLIAVLILGNIQSFSWPIIMVSGVVALAATALEAFSKFGLDNFTVPLGSAAIAYGLCSFFMF